MGTQICFVLGKHMICNAAETKGNPLLDARLLMRTISGNAVKPKRTKMQQQHLMKLFSQKRY